MQVMGHLIKSAVDMQPTGPCTSFTACATDGEWVGSPPVVFAYLLLTLRPHSAFNSRMRFCLDVYGINAGGGMEHGSPSASRNLSPNVLVAPKCPLAPSRAACTIASYATPDTAWPLGECLMRLNVVYTAYTRSPCIASVHL